MSIPGSGSPLLFSADAAAAAGYEIERSLRFNSADSAYLNRTPSAGSRTTVTFSCWVKRSKLGTRQSIFGNANSAGSIGFAIEFKNDDRLEFFSYNSSFTFQKITSAKFRDVSGWYSLIFVVDTSNSTAEDRQQIYVNGTRVTAFDTSTNSGPSANTEFGTTAKTTVGRAGDLSPYYYLDGYLADVHFIDGQALAATDFGEFDATTGAWNPIAYSGSHGTNGFKLDFSDSSSASALGTDSSGNGNDWTVNNIVATSAGPLTSAITAVSNSTATLSYSAQFVQASSESLSTSQFDANKQAGLFACWMKHEGGTTNADDPWIFGAGTNSAAHTILYCDTAGKLTFYDYDAAPTKQFGVNTGVTSLRDGNWHHVLVKWDTTQATSTNRVKIYIDGSEETLSGSYPGQNTILRIGGGGYTHYIADQPYERKWWDCKLAQVVYLNGAQSYGPSDFIEADGRPKTSLSITFGNNSSYFTFSNSGNIGANSSGYGSDWTVNGTPTQSTSDTPSKTTSTLTFTDTTNFGLFSVGDAVTQNDDAASGTIYTITSGSSQMAIKDVTGTFATTKRLEGPAEGTDADIDSLFDSPTNGTQTDTGAGGEVSGNYPTFNPLMYQSTSAMTNGNLDIAPGGASYGTAEATIAVSSGKWYWEVTINTATTSAFIGIRKPTDSLATFVGNTANSYAYSPSNKWYNGNNVSYGASFGAGDTIGVALDLDNGNLVFYKNGASQGTAYTGLSGTFVPAISEGGGGDVTLSINFGQRAFANNAPANHKCINTANFDTPTIEDPSTVMDVALWTGTASPLSVTGYNFSPDFVWIKNRTDSSQHHLYDVIRGIGKRLSTSSNAAENDYASSSPNSSLLSFDSTGFTVGDFNGINGSGDGMVGWAWDAGNTTTSITADSLTSSLYDTSQTWSNSLASSSGFRGPEPATNAFDGNTVTIASAVDNGVITFTSPVTFASSSTIRVIVHGGTHNVSVNGGSNQVISAGSFVTLNFTNPTASTFTITFQRTTSADTGVRAIEIGGKILVDSSLGLSVPSIASSVRANASAGFSIATYTGNGTGGATVGHGLGVKPSFYIVKRRNATEDWFCHHQSHPAQASSPGSFIKLNFNEAGGTAASVWNNTDPTSSVISLGTNTGVNASGSTYVLYAWTAVEGYSAFGSYTGNGSSDGPFVYTGFRSAWILVKRADSALAGWTIFDNKRLGYNPDNNQLYPNQADGDGTADMIDILSNGFKNRTNNSWHNASGGTYIYAAFAENPFKTARAR